MLGTSASDPLGFPLVGPAPGPEEYIAMTTNVGTADRVIRVVLAVVAAIVGFSVGAGSVLGIVLLVVAAVLLVTAAVGFCPLYRLVGLSTSKAKQPLSH
jgi:type IV secretory pathway TrbD component